ncbi:SAP domain protein [Teladorsagia circumcincta]|uniref:SAP domain protein n=1 Tax=Teladorsagia circumcincta TaxID=45464 RepID=A0A2G9UA26_TELCI|nr:SAP domain protein [Teladorsagia circumcincta]
MTDCVGEQKLLSELRVTELKQELEKRNLDKNGIKIILTDRLEKVETVFTFGSRVNIYWEWCRNFESDPECCLRNEGAKVFAWQSLNPHEAKVSNARSKLLCFKKTLKLINVWASTSENN